MNSECEKGIIAASRKIVGFNPVLIKMNFGQFPNSIKPLQFFKYNLTLFLLVGVCSDEVKWSGEVAEDLLGKG